MGTRRRGRGTKRERWRRRMRVRGGGFIDGAAGTRGGPPWCAPAAPLVRHPPSRSPRADRSLVRSDHPTIAPVVPTLHHPVNRRHPDNHGGDAALHPAACAPVHVTPPFRRPARAAPSHLVVIKGRPSSFGPSFFVQVSLRTTLMDVSVDLCCSALARWAAVFARVLVLPLFTRAGGLPIASVRCTPVALSLGSP